MNPTSCAYDEKHTVRRRTVLRWVVFPPITLTVQRIEGRDKVSDAVVAIITRNGFRASAVFMSWALRGFFAICGVTSAVERPNLCFDPYDDHIFLFFFGPLAATPTDSVSATSTDRHDGRTYSSYMLHS